MEEVNVTAKLTTPGNELLVESKGLYDPYNNVLQYWEEDENNTKMQFNFKDCILERDNQNLKMEYQFILGETTKNKVEVKDLEQTLLVAIKTIECILENRKAYIKYQVVDANEECIYELEF